MSLDSICYPPAPKPEKESAASITPLQVAPIEITLLQPVGFDSRDIVIACLTGALVLVLIALFVSMTSQMRLSI